MFEEQMLVILFERGLMHFKMPCLSLNYPNLILFGTFNCIFILHRVQVSITPPS
jgi:hypothetical protein